tara:strand:+ start:277 stop:1188 length:912 start_codon:yes stop_codon:yes gene_type:complete
MAVTTTQTHPKLLWPGLLKVWSESMHGDWDEEYSKIFDSMESEKAFEEMQQVTYYGLAPEKAQGSALTYDAEQQGYNKRFTHVAYALGFQITREAKDDLQYMEVATQRINAVARSMKQTVEVVNANHLNRATNSSYTGADGVVLLSTAHPRINGGTDSNKLSTAADLSETSIEDMVVQMMKAVDDRGLKIQVQPRALCVHPNEYFNAHRIVGSALQNDTANNAVNVVKSQGIFSEGVNVNHYFDDADQWFIKSNVPGMFHIWRTRPEFANDDDFATKNDLYSGYMRFSSGWADWRAIWGSEGA